MTTLTLQPDAAGGYDTMIFDQYTTKGTSTNLILGKDDLGDYYKILIKFTGISAIPSNAIINSATMQLYMWQEGSNYVVNWIGNRILKDWVETEATNEYYRATGQPWGSSGADLCGTDIDCVTPLFSGSFVQNPTYGWYNFNIDTTEFKKFINGTYPNYGWRIGHNGTYANNSAYWFYSSDYATASLRPKFVVDYIIPSGGSQTIWWFKKWWKEQQEKQPRILLPQGVTM